MQYTPPVSGVYADAVASSKFEVGVGGRWISLGVIAKAEAYPFLSAVTPQKNETRLCLRSLLNYNQHQNYF